MIFFVKKVYEVLFYKNKKLDELLKIFKNHVKDFKYINSNIRNIILIIIDKIKFLF